MMNDNILMVYTCRRLRYRFEAAAEQTRIARNNHEADAMFRLNCPPDTVCVRYWTIDNVTEALAAPGGGRSSYTRRKVRGWR